MRVELAHLGKAPAAKDCAQSDGKGLNSAQFSMGKIMMLAHFTHISSESVPIIHINSTEGKKQPVKESCKVACEFTKILQF